jgi:hypothetical protein
MKFLLNIGAEKSGTTWLYDYFRNHPDFYDMGKELNIIQRDDLVPLSEDVNEYRKNIESFFRAVSNINQVTGDFTHYEGSSENVFRLIKDGLLKYDIEVVPVYIMRDPIQRSLSAWNMLGGGNPKLSKAAKFIMANHLACKYKETVEALDSVFARPLYFFYEDFFTQSSIDKICEELNISQSFAECDKIVGQGVYKTKMSNRFLKDFGRCNKNIEAVKYINERFENVPWKLEDYS